MNPNSIKPSSHIGFGSATLVIIASMVGTGVFTTSGFLIRDLSSIWSIIIAWLVGGLFALTGALSYAELVTSIPGNGGEYKLLSKIYTPSIGFIAGWISLIVGFGAPVAAASLAFGHYFCAITPATSPLIAAITILTILSVLHGGWLVIAENIQNIFTVIKLILIFIFIVSGFWYGNYEYLNIDKSSDILNSMFSPSFAVGLIYISFAYSGWNGAAYIAGEIKNPTKSLPKAFFVGTAVVVMIYLGLNIVFFISAPKQMLAGVVEIGYVAAVNLFGQKAGLLLSGLIAMALISSISAMIMVGPRVYEQMGIDYSKLSFLKYRTAKNGPAAAVALQFLIAAIMILTTTFESLLAYIGYLLALSAGLTVTGLLILRIKQPRLKRPYKIIAYPVTPLIFIGLCTWMVVHAIFEKPFIAIMGIVTIGTGLLLYAVIKNSKQTEKN